jgi:hypothetical protein
VSDKTATEQSMSQIQTETIRMYSARQSSALISNLLREFIPDACRRDANDALMEAFYREQMELTSIQQRLEMEQIRKTMLHGLNMPLSHMLQTDETKGKK